MRGRTISLSRATSARWGAFFGATAALGEQRPFGYYRITRLSDGRAVGGIGFKGQPDGGCVEIGYGLAPSARGHGYAAEAVIALLTVAADHGLSRVIADTTLDNIASQRTLIRAGFRLVSTDAELHHYEVLLKRGHRHVAGDWGTPGGKLSAVKIKDFGKSSANVELSQAELILVNNALNEVSSRVAELSDDHEFATRLGASRADAREPLMGPTTSLTG